MDFEFYSYISPKLCMEIQTKLGHFFKKKGHCCMKCPQILREKTLSQKHTVIALRIQWKVSAEGKCL
jgi:hypothetical protein